jgi:hypothetical protein
LLSPKRMEGGYRIEKNLLTGGAPFVVSKENGWGDTGQIVSVFLFLRESLFVLIVNCGV